MSDNGRGFRPGDPRSAGAIPQRRVPQAWPKDRRFRILSIDGGGIRGIFPAAVMAGLEQRYTEEIQSHLTSILSPALQPAESLPLGWEPATPPPIFSIFM
jgi:hypothetical protein